MEEVGETEGHMLKDKVRKLQAMLDNRMLVTELEESKSLTATENSKGGHLRKKENVKR